jgi:hypothetical protein
MFPVEHSLSFQPEGFSLLRSLCNGGRIFAAWSARTRAVTVDSERGVRGKYDGRHKTRKWNKDPQTGCGFLMTKLGSSRETAKSENHSSSNILAVYKRLKTEICGKSHKFS